MFIKTLQGGEQVSVYKKSVIVKFPSVRDVVSTSQFNGGFRQDLTAVFNQDCKTDDGKDYVIYSDDYQEHMQILSQSLELNPHKTSGMITAAHITSLAMATENYNELEVTAIVTAGMLTNGTRACDSACFVEGEDTPPNGTINIIIVLNCALPTGALANVMIPCTEAKTSAAQELLVACTHSQGLATGTGTDSIIVVCDPNSPLKLTYTGTHTKIGELVGKTVKKAVKESLEKQCNLTPSTQHNVTARLARFGLKADYILNIAKNKCEEKGENFNEIFDETLFLCDLEKIILDDVFVTYASLYAHLLDQFVWGLLSANEVINAGADILNLLNKTSNNPSQTLFTSTCKDNSDNNIVIKEMIKNFAEVIVCKIISEHKS